MTAMVLPFTVCVTSHHTLCCGHIGSRRRKSVHGGLVAIVLAGGGRWGSETTLTPIRTPPPPFIFSMQLSLCFLRSSLCSALFYQRHQISHIINRKCERGNFVSRKVKRQTFYCLFRGDFKSTNSIKMKVQRCFVILCGKKSGLENLIVAISSNESCLMVVREQADRRPLILLTYTSVFLVLDGDIYLFNIGLIATMSSDMLRK